MTSIVSVVARFSLAALLPGSPPVVRLILTSSEPMDASHLTAVKQLIREHVGQDILAEAFLKLRQ